MIIKLFLKYNYNREPVFVLEYAGCRKIIHIIQFDFREETFAKKGIDIFFSFLDNFKRMVEFRTSRKQGEIENKEELFSTVLKYYVSTSTKNQPTKTDKLVELL